MNFLKIHLCRYFERSNQLSHPDVMLITLSRRTAICQLVPEAYGFLGSCKLQIYFLESQFLPSQQGSLFCIFKKSSYVDISSTYRAASYFTITIINTQIFGHVLNIVSEFVNIVAFYDLL